MSARQPIELTLNLFLCLLFASTPVIRFVVRTRQSSGRYPCKPRLTVLSLLLLVALAAACTSNALYFLKLKRTNLSLELVPRDGNEFALAGDVLSPAVLNATLTGRYSTGALSAIPIFAGAADPCATLRAILEVRADPESHLVVVSIADPKVAHGEAISILNEIGQGAITALSGRVASVNFRVTPVMSSGESALTVSMFMLIAIAVGHGLARIWNRQNPSRRNEAAADQAAAQASAG
jgi:hypothetical protein